MKGKGLRDFIWNSAGITAFELNSLLFMVLVTRIGQGGLSDVGVFSLAYTSAVIFFTVAAYGVRAYQVTDLAGGYTDGQYSAARLVTCFAAFGMAVLFALINRYDVYKCGILLLLSAAKIIEGYSDVYYGILQKQGRLDLAGKSNLIKSLLGFLLFYGILARGGTLIWACASLIAVNLLVLFLCEKRWVYRIARPKLQFSRGKTRALLAACFPVFAVAVLAQFLINVPRFAVDGHMTAVDLGVFGILFMQANVLNLLTKYLIQFSMTGIARAYVNKDRKGLLEGVCSSVGLILGAGALLCAFYWFCGRWFFLLLFDRDLSAYAQPTVVIVAGAALFFGVQVFYTALTAMRETRVQLYIILADVAFGLAIASPMVRLWGIPGAAAAFAFVAAVQFAAAGAAFFISLQRKLPRGRSEKFSC